MLSKSRGGGRVNEASGSADLRKDASAESGDEAHEPELAAATMFEELAEARAEAAACIDDEHLAIRTLGGNWTAANKHDSCDAWQGRAASRAAIEWAGRYRLPSAARFDISLYGADGALCCAKCWCQQLGCFFQTWLDAGAPRPYEFGLEDRRARGIHPADRECHRAGRPNAVFRSPKLSTPRRWRVRLRGNRTCSQRGLAPHRAVRQTRPASGSMVALAPRVRVAVGGERGEARGRWWPRARPWLDSRTRAAPEVRWVVNFVGGFVCDVCVASFITLPFRQELHHRSRQSFRRRAKRPVLVVVFLASPVLVVMFFPSPALVGIFRLTHLRGVSCSPHPFWW